MITKKSFNSGIKEISETKIRGSLSSRNRFDFAAGRIPPVKPEVVSRLLQEAKNWTPSHVFINEAKAWCPFSHCTEEQIQTTKGLGLNLSSAFEQKGRDSEATNEAWEQLERDARQNPATRDFLRFLAARVGYPVEQKDEVVSDYEKDSSTSGFQQDIPSQPLDTRQIDPQRQQHFQHYFDENYLSDDSHGFWEASGPPFERQIDPQQRSVPFGEKGYSFGDFSSTSIETSDKVKTSAEEEHSEKIQILDTEKYFLYNSDNNRKIKEQWEDFNRRNKKGEFEKEISILRRAINNFRSLKKQTKEKTEEIDAYNCQVWLRLIDPVIAKEVVKPEDTTEAITNAKNPEEALDNLLRFNRSRSSLNETETNFKKALSAFKKKVQEGSSIREEK